MMEAKHLLKIEEEGGLPFAQFSLDYKTVAHSVLGVQHSLASQASCSHKSLLIHPFASGWILSAET